MTGYYEFPTDLIVGVHFKQEPKTPPDGGGGGGPTYLCGEYSNPYFGADTLSGAAFLGFGADVPATYYPIVWYFITSFGLWVQGNDPDYWTDPGTIANPPDLAVLNPQEWIFDLKEAEFIDYWPQIVAEAQATDPNDDVIDRAHPGWAGQYQLSIAVYRHLYPDQLPGPNSFPDFYQPTVSGPMSPLSSTGGVYDIGFTVSVPGIGYDPTDQNQPPGRPDGMTVVILGTGTEVNITPGSPIQGQDFWVVNASQFQVVAPLKIVTLCPSNTGSAQHAPAVAIETSDRWTSRSAR